VTDNNAKNNTFDGNQIHTAKIGISISNNTASEFAGNTIGVVDDSEYYVNGNSSVNLKNTTFSTDRIKSADGDRNLVNIFSSGTLDIKGNTGNKTTVDTNKDMYSLKLPTSGSVTVRTVG